MKQALTDALVHNHQFSAEQADNHADQLVTRAEFAQLIHHYAAEHSQRRLFDDTLMDFKPSLFLRMASIFNDTVIDNPDAPVEIGGGRLTWSQMARIRLTPAGQWFSLQMMHAIIVQGAVAAPVVEKKAVKNAAVAAMPPVYDRMIASPPAHA